MIKGAKKEDIKVVTNLALELWPEHTFESLANEIIEEIESKDTIFLIKYFEDQPIGFAHCQLRHDYVEGTDSSPVAYLEGIYIKEHFRKNGFAKEIIKECEKWAKKNNCSQFASDCEISNNISEVFHKSLGFKEANRIICFVKDIK